MRSAVQLCVAAIILAVLGGVYVFSTQYASGSTQVVHVRWVVAHEPVVLFDAAQQTFVEVFNKNSDGLRIVIDGIGPKDAGKPERTPLSTGEVFDMLESNTVEMASIVVSSLHKEVPLVGVLSLPYLFADTTAAEAALEGGAVNQVLETISSTTRARALAFTYSGGFQLIQTRTKKIESPGDLVGMRIGSQNAGVTQDVLKAMGATPVHLEKGLNNLAIQELLETGKLDGVEYTYTRLFFATTSAATSTINETYHSVFLTSIIVSDSFFDSLSVQNKRAFEKAAFEAARVERSDSLALAQKTKDELIANGYQIVSPTPVGREAFKKATVGVYKKYAPQFGQHLIDSIRAAQN